MGQCGEKKKKQHLLVILLDVIAKLTLTVKPQPTLRTLKWVACAPDDIRYALLCFALDNRNRDTSYLCSAMCFLKAFKLDNEEEHPGTLHMNVSPWEIILQRPSKISWKIDYLV